MVISASRRTDIPAFYSEWLLGRIEAGFVQTKNPFNPTQIRQVSLQPDGVDCFVFWTKDPLPMMERLDTLDRLGFDYYFQFTLTPYDRALEQNLRDKPHLIETFQALSRRLGKHRVLWRNDPIILGGELSIAYHREQFQRMCDQLAPYTTQVTISFVDLYPKIRTSRIRPIRKEEIYELAADFAQIGAQHGLPVAACCEALDLSTYGIQQAHCIDKALVERIIGREITAKKDRNQRSGCGCVSSVDIGAYNTCGNGCVYCYANRSPLSVSKNMARHDPAGAFLVE